MRPDAVTALLWLVTAACALAACVLSIVTGDWLAAVGFATAVVGTLGAGGQSARLYQLHRDLGVIGYGVHKAPPRQYDERDDDDPMDGMPRDFR